MKFLISDSLIYLDDLSYQKRRLSQVLVIEGPSGHHYQTGTSSHLKLLYRDVNVLPADPEMPIICQINSFSL
jgi:hypothetical protein